MLRICLRTYIVLFFSVLVAYGQVTTGTISGTVSDSTGAVLPGATIVVQNQDTGVTRTVRTDAAGRYSASDLGVGNYQASASLTGFQSENRTGLVLTVGREAVVDFKLQVGSVSQTVEVTGEAPLVQTSEATMSNLVNDTSIRELPLNGRDLSQLILLSPNVTQAVDSKSTFSYNGFGRRISIAGFQGEANAYLLDGGYVDDFYHHIPSGPTGELLGVETVQEFTVLTSTFGAQYGRALGGVFNAVSRSGSNSFHGDAFEFLRNNDLDDRSFFDQGGGPPAFRRNQFGGTVGGPIKKDKTFFFASYEALRQTLGTTNTAIVPLASVWQGGLGPVASSILQYQSLFPLPTPGAPLPKGQGQGEYIFVANTPTSFDFGQARIDHQFSSKDSLFGRYSGSSAVSTASQGLPEFTGEGSLGFHYFTLSETHIFTAAVLNSAHFQFDRVTPHDIGTYPATPAGAFSFPGAPPPALTISGGFTSEEGLAKPLDYFFTNRFGYQDDVNWVKGSHTMAFGGMLERLQFNMEVPDRPFGEWQFNSITAFVAGTPTQYRGTPPGIGNPIRGFRQWEMALYFQDDWRVTPKLTLNLGVRWEPYTVPTEQNGLVANLRHLTDANSVVGNPYWINRSWKNIGPRFGFAWSPFGDGKTSIRGGFGEYFIPTDSLYTQDSGTRVPPLFPFYQIPSTTANLTAAFPNALPLLESIGSTFTTGDVVQYQHLNTQHSLSWNLSVQRQLGADNVLTVGYEGNRGIDILAYLSENTPNPTYDGISLAVSPTDSQATLPNPAFNNVSYWANAANSWYNALTARFERRLAAGLTASVSYTFSKAESESDGGKSVGGDLGSGSSVKDAYNLLATKSLSGYDIRNSFTTSADYQLPFGKGKGWQSHLISGWEMNGILSLQGGLPTSLSASSPAALSGLNPGTRTPNATGCSYSQIVPGIQSVGGLIQYFNPSCFSAPTALELGNVDENSIIGPGLISLNFGVVKNFAMTERTHLQFRAEAFNLTNRVNFAEPSGSIFSASAVPGTLGTSGGTITATVPSAPGRQIQFGAKLIF